MCWQRNAVEDRTKNPKKKSEKQADHCRDTEQKDSVSREKNNLSSPVGQEATEPDMKHLIGSKFVKEYNKSICCILLI